MHRKKPRSLLGHAAPWLMISLRLTTRAKAAGAAFDACRGCLTVAVALQHLGADGFFDLLDHLVPVALNRVAVVQRVDDVGLAPLVELLHEALWFFLFGHMFVPFGKLQCFGSGPLALLATT